MAGGNALFRMKKAKEGFSYLEKHYSLANNRGYIWAKTWNLLKAHPLLGTGPDTFLIAFPNDDLVGLYNSGHSGEMISKPHCLYLQIAAQTGIPSLIRFFDLCVMVCGILDPSVLECFDAWISAENRCCTSCQCDRLPDHGIIQRFLYRSSPDLFCASWHGSGR